ncbi:MAG: hypothetical protein O2973_04130 [Gemmatimonadetes bacterium]|nr:hypothetical protein [Gemmatimonadota bacterium]
MDNDRKGLNLLYGGYYHALWGAGVMVLFVGVALIAGFPVPLRSHPVVLVVLAAIIGFATGKLVGRLLLDGSGMAAKQFYMPDAAGTYVQQHSEIDTLEARGNYQGAVDAWEAVAIAEPLNAWALIRAGELYMRKLSKPQMALERFLGAREIATIGVEHRMYASQKIIDLYLGPLEEPGRALVELRRFSETHPGTREAAHALEALARLKAERRDR